TSSATQDQFRSDSVGLYLFETLKLTEKFQLSGGLRWDYFDAHYHTAAGLFFERLDKTLTWRAAALYKPARNGSVYFGYSTSVNPSAEGITLAANNVLLDPEEARNFELGTKWDFLEERLALTFALFRTEKTNARTPGLPGELPMVLAGAQRVDGVEAGVAGSLTRKWRVFGGYTFMDSEVEKSNTAIEVGKEIPGVPRHMFNVWTTYELPWNLEIGGGAQYQSSAYIDPANVRVAPDYWLMDAMAAYKVNTHFTLRLNVYNLADEDHYIGTLYTVGSRGQLIPGARRSAILTASIKF
ncbi:MAG TPA: TonB-dependent receptor, partial [Verrucomicrobiae bacterium]|nr:TonB-dependent receptor [Verrucomicrobiae bacterium]